MLATLEPKPAAAAVHVDEVVKLRIRRLLGEWEDLSRCIVANTPSGPARDEIIDTIHGQVLAATRLVALR